MPLGWRSAARSNVSPSSCAPGDPPARLSGPVTEAFADRTRIDWAALLRRVRHPGDRDLIEALRSLDRLRAGSLGAAPPPAIRFRLLGVLVLVAIVQIMSALGGTAAALATGSSLNAVVHQVLLVWAFSAASILLAAAAPREPRATLLLATWLFCGAAFARAAMPGLPAPVGLRSPVFRGIVLEAFAPAALWQFAVLFPNVTRFTRFDQIARAAAGAAWAFSALLFAANLLLAYGSAGAPLTLFWRDDPGNIFWHAFVLSACPAVATIFIRAYRADRVDRQKVLRFAAAIAAGAAPFLVAGLARLTFPAADRWILTSHSLARVIVETLVLGSLAGMPLMVALAVVLDRPFEPASTGIGFLTSGRQRARRYSVRRLVFGPGRRHAERLTEALERMQLVRGRGDIVPLLGRELRFGLHAATVLIVDPAALPRDTALVALLDECSRPVDLSRTREPFVLLPQRDRDWLDGNAVVLASPLRLADGTIPAIALLGPRRDDAPWSAADRWFVRALLTAAAAAWDRGITRAVDAGDEAAFECRRCGLVAGVEVSCCHARMTRAAIPRTIGGKFTIVRKLGAGGSGTVYLADDTRLSRKVALKTLSASAQRIGDLRDEARAMAALNHVSLATIYGLESWRRTPVLVVEYFPRGTLAERLREGPMRAGEVVALGVRIADGLRYMHDRGLLHRDLKPSNIGITAEGAPKLFDFGLAPDARMPAGTPAYLPPEALEGADPDVQVDLWGLAMVMCEACGDREIPEPLRAFLTRALAPDPRDRFRSASDMHAALARIAAPIADDTLATG